MTLLVIFGLTGLAPLALRAENTTSGTVVGQITDARARPWWGR
ncbi:MAG: hypothetical protein ACRD0Y_07270 [Terriglobales bacterium]